MQISFIKKIGGGGFRVTKNKKKKNRKNSPLLIHTIEELAPSASDQQSEIYQVCMPALLL